MLRLIRRWCGERGTGVVTEAPGSAHLILARNVVHLDPGTGRSRRPRSGATKHGQTVLRVPHRQPIRLDAGVRRQVRVSTQLVFHGDYEGSPRRRPLMSDEIQALFDAADRRVEKMRAEGRKGALAAMHDSAMLEFCYAFGLRRSGVCNIDMADRRRNYQAPQCGSSGSVGVRFGKAARGVPAKRRTVLTVPEFDQIVEVREHYLTEIRSALAPGGHPALSVTDSAGRISSRSVNAALTAAREGANLDPILDLHCPRHSYVTHLIEFDYPVRFVQEQVGHAPASTTSIYTGVSNEYRNQLLTRAIRNRHGEPWSESRTRNWATPGTCGGC